MIFQNHSFQVLTHKAVPMQFLRRLLIGVVMAIVVTVALAQSEPRPIGTPAVSGVLSGRRSSAQKAEPGLSLKEQIKLLEEERNRAILSGDAAALDRMTSDDYTFITLRGEMRTKAEIVKGFQSGSFKYESRTISDLNIRAYGDTAVVTGRSTQKGVENGKDYSGNYWFTRVYVKEDGRWLTVALQTTPVRP